MFNTLRSFQSNEPNQREQAKGTVPNAAGGYSFAVSDKEQFKRFLILGTTGGTYYIKEKKLTEENLEAVQRFIDSNGAEAIQIIVEVSESGRAFKNDPAIYALAMAASCKDPATRAMACAAIPKVCRIFTHLSHFVSFIRQGEMRGWGRGLIRGIANWYNEMPVQDLVNQIIKYQSRDGYSQKDIYRLAHVGRPDLCADKSAARKIVYKYISKGELPPVEDLQDNGLERLFAAHHVLKNDYVGMNLVSQIQRFRLPMEVVPTDKRNGDVYASIAQSAGLTWILRNLGNLSKVEAYKEDIDLRKHIIQRLTDAEQIKKARLHPLSIWQAMKVYSAGKGEKGKSTWTPDAKIIDALDEAFYKSFEYVEPTGKRILYAVDSSGSMRNQACAGMNGTSVFEAAAIMCMAASKVEENFELICYDTVVYQMPTISHRQRIDDIARKFAEFGGGGTNCALPFAYAQQENKSFDGIVSFTDSETWSGHRHPFRELNAYRKSQAKPVKAINVAMAANRSSILAEGDLDAMEVIGFDTNVPSLISQFIGGQI